VLGTITLDPLTIDQVITKSGLTTPQVLSTLSILEMRRLVKRLGGNLVARP
jgi:DNA processing protein